MENKYSSNFLDYASKVDAIVGACGEITRYASEIINDNNEESCRKLIKKIENLSKEKNKGLNTAITALHDSLINYYGFARLSAICKSEEQEDPENNKTLEELLSELNNLVGLQKVKNQVNDLIKYQKIQKLRREKKLFSETNTLHMAFIGNPGTGKTTVARIVGHIYKKIGLLSRGHFIEVSRTDLIAGYQGQTAIKVKGVIERAKGGVLFIDEAYSITENDHSDSYGRECLTELTKALEDYRNDLVVIVAGYTEPMKNFFESNPGLKSRFNTFIYFDDYSASELTKIFESICKKNDYILSSELKENIETFLEQQLQNKDENFANGRLVRNIFDDLVIEHAKRVVEIKKPNVKDLQELLNEDFDKIKMKYSIK
ncbi:AAA family ATPase [Treponema sp.]|uniref:AAA family ATPase n=1 Tax=Treponema sp. TaxID=166 RepID=UPI003FD6E14A